MKLWTYLLPAIVVFTACSEREPTLDGSSDTAFRKSAETVLEAATDEQRMQWGEVVPAIAFEGMDVFSLMMTSDADPETVTKQLRERVDGMTIAEVIELGEKILAETRAEEERAALEEQRLKRKSVENETRRIRAELEELREEHRRYIQARDGLRDFQVTHSRFEWSEGSISRSPIIELTVHNETGRAVSRAYFHGKVYSPGREIPWVDDSFNYQIRGGLEAGETATWRLSPNMFGPWGNVPRDRDDIALAVQTVRIDGADGDAIFDIRDGDTFTPRIERKIERLKQMQEWLESLPES